MNATESRLYAETKPMSLNAQQVALIRAVLERRAKTFLAAVESECQARSATRPDAEAKRMGVSVFSWEEDWRNRTDGTAMSRKALGIGASTLCQVKRLYGTDPAMLWQRCEVS